jgi:aspartyl-tRNA synthetase
LPKPAKYPIILSMRILTSDIGKHEGKKVTLMGWVSIRRDHGKLIFIDLRDRTGLAQCVFVAKDKILFGQAEQLRPEWVIKLTGQVNKRPENLINPDLASGQWEIKAENIEIISEAQTPPIAIDSDGFDIGEESRLKYRYLDLRRPRLQKNLRMRHKTNQFIRNHLTAENFVEIETPILSKSTPEGARDFLVPSRMNPGKFYALPQSPQQYKQLLMVAGFEKYFQLPHCFRDEDPRGDRQPGFTQLDIEMSFTDSEEVMQLTEDLMIKLVKEIYPDKKIKQTPFPRLTHKEAMKKYKSDRPDLRNKQDDPDELAFAFVVDFPAFEYKEGDKRWGAMHHPFTQPKVKDAKELKKAFADDPGKILAYQYDLVLNGYEVGGGSIRIHDPKLLQASFEVLGNKSTEVEAKFGHILKAFDYGVPPHGGVALGLDRLVAILNNEPNIREVIAFPKTGEMQDLMMNSPSEVSADQLKELSLEIKKKKK